ncbi:SusC/RagA family TonB-linked outer membrane protein [Bacteroidia bacterium]|nr:SusC/RagA family TonB-linked outer membrane protein [Bacteroidia bacterium]
MNKLFNMNLIKLRILVCLTILCVCPVFAQSKVIKGKVIDANTNESLPGVTITGTQTGAISDIEGEFQISINTSDDNSVLSFSSIGYKAKKVKIDPNSSYLEVRMEEDTHELEGVVVVGYGVQKKVTLTGSVGSVGEKPFLDKPTNNAVSSLQGQIPGLTIMKGNSVPGDENWDIKIRGSASINNTRPLVIIDGIPAVDQDELFYLNASDIENISVLKDASASIYGARAAGGVILVTTKKGKAGKTQLTYNGNMSLSYLGRNRPVMSVQQWITTLDEAYTNIGRPEENPFGQYKDYFLNPDNGATVLNPGPFNDTYDICFFDTDWKKVLYGNGVYTTHDVALSGGSENNNYYVSFGYTHQDDILKVKLYDDKYSLRLSDNMKLLNNKLNVGIKMTFEQEDRLKPSLLENGFGAYSAWVVQPGMPVYTQSGNYYAWGGQPSLLGALGSCGNFTEVWHRLNTGVDATYSITKELSLTGQLGLNYWWYNAEKQVKQATFYSYDDQWSMQYPNINDTEYGTARDLHRHKTYQLYATYEKNIHQAHNFKWMLGGSAEDEKYQWLNVNVKNITSDLLSLTAGDKSTLGYGENKYAWSLASVFSRLNYDYKGKYLIEGNFRSDGASQFIKEKRWKSFGGVSLGWRASEESFMKNLNFFDNLKWRGSYGNSGNQSGISYYDYIQFLSFGNSYPFGDSYTKTRTAGLGSLASPLRTWETIVSGNLGLDFAFLHNRLSGSVDIFRKKNINMLIGLTYPAQIGADVPASNNGKMTTKGFEINLTWSDKIGKDFKYSLTGNLADAKTVIDYIDGGSAINVFGPTFARQGYPINAYFGYVYDGVIRSQEELDAYKETFPNGGLPADLGIGDAKYLDANGTGHFDRSGTENLVYIGSQDPRYTYGINLNMEYKGFDFTTFFQGVGDIWTFRADNKPFVAWWNNASSGFYGNTYNNNPESPLYNSGAYYPRIMAGGDVKTYNWDRMSTMNVINQAYCRLKNISLGYTFPQQWLDKAGISKLRVYVTGTDLWEWVKNDDGYDPERIGDNYKKHPAVRSVSFGINLNF